MQNNNSKVSVKNKYIQALPYLREQRTQKFLGIFLTLIALSFFGLFAINPTISTIAKLQKEISDSEFVSDQLDLKIKNISTLKKEYSLLQNEISTITDAIPKEPNAHLLFAQIQAAAQQSNIKIKKLQNSEIEIPSGSQSTNKEYYSYIFAVSGDGTFQNISDFTKTITSMQRVTSIDLLSITNNDGQSLRFDLEGSAFFKN
jgi:Tfp pilus assembly protein PilO